MKALLFIPMLFCLNAFAFTKTMLSEASDVQPAQEVCDEFTPIAGNVVSLNKFRASAEGSGDTSIVVLWDFQGGGEIIKWSSNGAADLAHLGVIIGTGDGTIKVGLCLRNNDVGVHTLSGNAIFKGAQ